VGATVNAPGAALANSAHAHECIVGSRLEHHSTVELDMKRSQGKNKK
jgi:hypothetical protein